MEKIAYSFIHSLTQLAPGIEAEQMWKNSFLAFFLDVYLMYAADVAPAKKVHENVFIEKNSGLPISISSLLRCYATGVPSMQ